MQLKQYLFLFSQLGLNYGITIITVMSLLHAHTVEATTMVITATMNTTITIVVTLVVIMPIMSAATTTTMVLMSNCKTWLSPINWYL